MNTEMSDAECRCSECGDLFKLRELIAINDNQDVCPHCHIEIMRDFIKCDE